MENDVIRNTILIYIRSRMAIMPDLDKLIKSATTMLEREALRSPEDKSGCAVVPTELFCSLLAAFTTSNRLFEFYGILDEKSAVELEKFVNNENEENSVDMKNAAEVMADEFIKKVMNKK